MMSTCLREAVLSPPKRAHVDWNWSISREEISRNKSVKMPLHWLVIGVVGS